MRAYIESGLANREPVSRLFTTGPMFRYERPQKGRMRQFHQINCECLGSHSPYADADLISMLLRFLDALGLKDLTLKVNSLGCAECRPKFKEALLELKVLPTITDDSRVFLNLNVKKDEVVQFVDLGIYGSVPELARREINTAVLIEDGQTVVIGGVYEFSDRASVAKVPFLGDIPFLGNLFKKKGRSKEKAELLIFVTPKVLRVAERR